MSSVLKQKGRCAGVLMPVFSLPSAYGIGTFGKAACEFADSLKRAGQSCWQILPLGQPGTANSPYSCISSFAGNPLYIDLELLRDEGLLRKEELDGLSFGEDSQKIDYPQLEESKMSILRTAFERAKTTDTAEFDRFRQENDSWLTPYLRFLLLKKKYSGRSWNQWGKGSRQECPEQEFPEEAAFGAWLQYEFFRQWNALRDYVHEQGILIIGDLPVYVPYDSADVWSEPEQFKLTENNEPAFVSGVPPDAFSEDGQRWGNPLYDYKKMAGDGYGWWIRRVGAASRMYDAVRIDHFRGFASYYCIPAEEQDAKKGHWEMGPGIDLVGRLTSWFSDTAFIAEDLGLITEDVRRLLAESGLPGMRVLEFAFEPGADSTHLPHHYDRNTVVYTGTHDNAPLVLWEQEADREETAFAHRYLGIPAGKSLREGLIREAYKSTADLAVIPMQDWLGLGEGARINVPGVPEGNWCWRMREQAFTPALEKKMREYSGLYGR